MTPRKLEGRESRRERTQKKMNWSSRGGAGRTLEQGRQEDEGKQARQRDNSACIELEGREPFWSGQKSRAIRLGHLATATRGTRKRNRTGTRAPENPRCHYGISVISMAASRRGTWNKRVNGAKHYTGCLMSLQLPGAINTWRCSVVKHMASLRHQHCFLV